MITEENQNYLYMNEHSIQANLFCFIFEHKLPFFLKLMSSTNSYYFNFI